MKEKQIATELDKLTKKRRNGQAETIRKMVKNSISGQCDNSDNSRAVSYKIYNFFVVFLNKCPVR